MWNKVKNIFAVLGSVLTAFLVGLGIYSLGRSNSDGLGGTDADEKSRRVTEGIDSATDRAEKCKDRLRESEEILRKAIEKSGRMEGHD